MVDFLPFYTRELNFVTSCLRSSASSPFWKGAYTKGKEFFPVRADIFPRVWGGGSKFFPFRVDPFSEGKKTSWHRYRPWTWNSYDVVPDQTPYQMVVKNNCFQEF